MGKFEPSLNWLRRQRTNAAQALADVQPGQKIEFDGVDVTDEGIFRYEQLIERYARLIEKYEQRDRETELSDTLRYKDQRRVELRFVLRMTIVGGQWRVPVYIRENDPVERTVKGLAAMRRQGAGYDKSYCRCPSRRADLKTMNAALPSGVQGI